MSGLTQEKKQIINQVANRLGTSPEWLAKLIDFETAGTFKEDIKNPYSSARGLIQIIDSSARSLGFRDSLEAVTRNPDFKSQMENVVYPYLKQYEPYPTKQSLYMAVFYPAYRYKNPSTEFPPHVQKVNPGIDTVQDYIDYVDRRVSNFPKSLPPLILIAAGGMILYYWKKSKRTSLI